MKTETLIIAMAQTNLLVGDMRGNADKVIDYALRARDELSADVVVFPELTLTGYPPEDLLHHHGVRDRVSAELKRIGASVQGIDLVLGYPEYAESHIYNVCALLRDGKAAGIYYKHSLPNYGVFDEKRYFASGAEAAVVSIKGLPIGLTICEDLWESGVALQARDAGARLLLNISASPYSLGRQLHREESVLRERVKEAGLPIVYVNLVGAQDELVFDGASLAVDATGQASVIAPSFDESLLPVIVHYSDDDVQLLPGQTHRESSLEESVYRALMLGVKDYVSKNAFKGCVLGLSGGIDSALTLAIAVDALGADRLTAVMMPSRFTSELSREIAVEQAEALGVELQEIPINEPVNAFESALRPLFKGLARDATEENIQARCRGVILMAISNKTGKLVLTTGNKSELAVGFATLYGDMAGGFAPLKDVYKTMVYRLARYRNSMTKIIPNRVIDREPTAELAEGQKDSDSLPNYEILDTMLEAYIEEDKTFDELLAAGFDREIVERVTRMVKGNEYKRRQAPPGVRISKRGFGSDRRYPITSGYHPDRD